MFSLNIKPPKNNNEHKNTTNNDHFNISNDETPNDDVLLIDLKTINLENISVELALNVLQLKHIKYYEMNQTDIIQYYNNKIKLTNNINTILALKIILKSKLKGIDVKINKSNGIMISKNESKINTQPDNKSSNTSNTEKKINSIISKSNNDFKIQQISHANQNNFKIVQNNNTHNQNINNKPNNMYLNQQLNQQSNQFNNLYPNNLFNKSEQSVQFNNSHSNSKIVKEKINDMVVINSSEFDIDSIINSYSQKKNLGFIK